jgi:uracil-DNA glycosylase
MTTTRSAADHLPATLDLDSLKQAAADCQGCDLYKDATQTVFGLGQAQAQLVLVGEQPGDREDIDGLPFVGPAGHMLDRAMQDLGVARDKVYVTNAVKHFKWVPKGKRRIHQTPRASEIRACQPWLQAEMQAIRPALIVALGATAVTSLLGAAAKVTKDRGHVLEGAYGPTLVTVHPSSLLRLEDEEERRAAYGLFVQDLRQGLEYLRRAA